MRPEAILVATLTGGAFGLALVFAGKVLELALVAVAS